MHNKEHKKHAILAPLSASGLQHKIKHGKTCDCERCRGKLGAKLAGVIETGRKTYPHVKGLNL